MYELQNEKKVFYDIFTFRLQRIYIHFKMQNTTLKYFNNGCLNCEKVLSLNMTSTTKVKVEHFHS